MSNDAAIDAVSDPRQSTGPIERLQTMALRRSLGREFDRK
jgi:hypothetical protein